MCVNKPLLPIGLLVGSWGSGGGFFFFHTLHSHHWDLLVSRSQQLISITPCAQSRLYQHTADLIACTQTPQTSDLATNTPSDFSEKRKKNLILKMRLRDLKISYFSLLHWVSPSHGCFPASAARAGRDCANFPSSLASSIQQIPPWRAFNSSRPQLLIVLVHSSPSCCQLRACWPTSSVSLFILG